MIEFNMDEQTRKRLSTFFNLLGGVVFGDVRKVKKMLDDGEDVNGRVIDLGFNSQNQPDSDPDIAETDTPLLVAVKSSAQVEIVQLLLERGADVTVKDKRGRTPLEIARERKLTDVVNMLEATAASK